MIISSSPFHNLRDTFDRIRQRPFCHINHSLSLLMPPILTYFQRKNHFFFSTLSISTTSSVSHSLVWSNMIFFICKTPNNNNNENRSTQKGRINGIDSCSKQTKKKITTHDKELGYNQAVICVPESYHTNNDAHTMPKSEMRKLKLKRKPCHKSYTIERET